MNKWQIFDFVTQEKAGLIWIENGQIKTDSSEQDIRSNIKETNENGILEPVALNGESIGLKRVKNPDMKFDDAVDEQEFLQSVLPDGYEIYEEGSEGPADEDYFQNFNVSNNDEYSKAVLEGFDGLKLSELGDNYVEEMVEEKFDNLGEEFDEDGDDESLKFFNPYHDPATGHFTYRPGGPAVAAFRSVLKKRAMKLMGAGVRSKTKNIIKPILERRLSGLPSEVRKEIVDGVGDYVTDLTIRVARPRVNRYVDELITKKIIKSKHEASVADIKIDEKVIRDIIEHEAATETEKVLGEVRRKLRVVLKKNRDDMKAEKKLGVRSK